MRSISQGTYQSRIPCTKSVQWLLRSQLADGSWFVPAKTTPVQPHIETGYPHGANQFASAGGSNWATMALLFTLPDRGVAKPVASKWIGISIRCRKQAFWQQFDDTRNDTNQSM